MTNEAYPSIDTLVADIYSLFQTPGGHTVDDARVEAMGQEIAEVVKARLKECTGAPRQKNLRLSKIGVPDRKLWYDLHVKNGESEIAEKDTEPEFLPPNTYIKFLYGDIIESLLIFLTKEAGHVVRGEQDELTCGGVVGHRDCVIDNVTVDVKSASDFTFKKFKEGTLHENDPFGYIAQISSYTQSDPTTSDMGAFLACNKVTGELSLLKVHKMDQINSEKRVQHIKAVVQHPKAPPVKCYTPIPDGKSGNKKLNSNCTYCPFKEACWSSANGGYGLRKYKYSTGIRYLTEVHSTPRVDEVP